MSWVGVLPCLAIGLLRLCSGQRRQCAQHQHGRLARPPRSPLGRRPGGALLRGGHRLRSRFGDDLPLRCLLLDLLTLACYFCAAAPAAASAQRRALARPRRGGAGRPYFWAAAIRFSLK